MTKGAGRPRVVVGYDGSPTARDALHHAARRVGKTGRLTVVHAYGPSPDWLGAPNYARLLEDHEERGRSLLEGLLVEEGESVIDVEFDTELTSDPPADALVRIARERDADEIVIGSRGFGRVRAALGSVSHAVLHVADRPVVVVPDTHRDDRG